MDVNKKYPIPSTEEEDVQQALGILWTQFEQGVLKRSELEGLLQEAIRPGILEELIQGGFVSQTEGNLCMLGKGLTIAHDMARRHRLAERLLTDVLELPREQIDPNACRLEHVITRDVEEAICTLLGHPQACPHGFSIPPGECCMKALKHTGPIVTPLSSMLEGQEGQIVYLSPHHRPELHRLLSMGLVPGSVVRVVQTSPAVVVATPDGILAMDPVLADHIFLRRKNGAGAHHEKQ
ncbi:MAG: metal-dependent transcriptional regulator [Elusimicrobia bacterium]|nr:metal-dependent transcriptional regulator [Elusimicrobiota bacterium]